MRASNALAACVMLVPGVLAAQRTPARAPSRPPASLMAPSRLLDGGVLAWDKGDYIAATDYFTRALTVDSSALYVDSIARMTGELYRTRELTADGSRPAFSPNGRYAAYETGGTQPHVTHVVDLGDGYKEILQLPGSGAAFSPSGNFVAYVHEGRVGVHDFRRNVHADVVGSDSVIAAAVAFGDHDDLFVVVGKPGETTRNDILRATLDGMGGVPVTVADGFKANPVPIAGGKFLLYSVPGASPIRQPGAVAGRGGAGGGAGAGGGRGTAFVIVNVATGETRRITGSSPTVSADGSTVAYLVRTGSVGNTGTGAGSPASGAAPAETSIMLMPVAGGDPVLVRRSSTPIDAPALSPDGRRVAFQMMPVYDWDIYVIDRDGKNETRLSRDIQHDVLPKWMDTSRVLAVQGEPRHRRAYVYNVKTHAATRLFSNNSVRTISPEYEWYISADGCKVLTVAERDGNTVSPERGVYVTDLDQKVTRAELFDRLKADHASEVSLRDRGLASFRVIAPQVRAVTDQVEVSRIYHYEKSMFDFDSKHISMPGNARVIAYLTDTYRAFGYQPEQQWFEPRGALGGKSANVIATLKGTENPELVYVISSHFDSRAEGPPCTTRAPMRSPTSTPTATSLAASVRIRCSVTRTTTCRTTRWK